MDFIQNCRLRSFPDGVHIDLWSPGGLHLESVGEGKVLRKGEKIPQGVIELNTSGKMTVTRENSITLNSCIGQGVVVHYGPSF